MHSYLVRVKRQKLTSQEIETDLSRDMKPTSQEIETDLSRDRNRPLKR